MDEGGTLMMTLPEAMASPDVSNLVIWLAGLKKEEEKEFCQLLLKRYQDDEDVCAGYVIFLPKPYFMVMTVSFNNEWYELALLGDDIHPWNSIGRIRMPEAAVREEFAWCREEHELPYIVAPWMLWLEKEVHVSLLIAELKEALL